MTSYELPDSNSSSLNVSSATSEEAPQQLLIVSVYSVLIVVATIGNVAMILHLMWLKRLTGVDKLVFNLAIANLFLAFLTLPPKIVEATTASWDLGNFYCKIKSFFDLFGLYLSALIVVSVGLEQYLSIPFSPVDNRKENQRVKIMIALAWVLAIIASFPQFLIFHVEELASVKSCASNQTLESAAAAVAYSVSSFLLYNVIPSVSVAAFCLAILLRSGHPRQDAPSSSVALADRLRLNELHLSLVISITFLVVSAPHCFVKLWYFIHPSSMYQLLSDDTIFILHSFAYMYACAAPLVYGVFQLRKRCEISVREADNERSESTSSQIIRPQLSELRSSSMERPLSAKGTVGKRSRLKFKSKHDELGTAR